MVDVAKVSMFGIPVGIFNWDDRYGVARFEYDQSFIGRGWEPSPLMMPVREGRVYSFTNWGRDTFQKQPGMLADSQPDTYGRTRGAHHFVVEGYILFGPLCYYCFL